ncbi:MAG: substrate-binding domain-containing protein [Phycisphaerae bacterium]|jgi:DNA-binding LacI/PurR family transcriptional regulator
MAEIALNEIDKKNGKKKPIYRQLIQYVRKDILDGKLVTGEHLPTTAQLTKRWGVGFSTVNSALNELEKEGLISRAVKWGKGPLIIGYKPKSPSETSLAFIRWANNAQFIAIENGIRQYTIENNLNFITISTRYKQEVSLPSEIKGLIIYPCDNPAFRRTLSDTLNKGVKVVLVDREMEGIQVSVVSPDHFHGTYEATKHLIETHHIPVHFWGYSERPLSVQSRWQGYLEAMNEAGYYVDKNSEYVINNPVSESDVLDMLSENNIDMTYIIKKLAKHIQDFLSKSSYEKFSFMAVNDDAAHSLYIAAEELGLKIGKDIFVVGFGNKPKCEKLSVKLSSVEQYDKNVGYAAAKLLHDKITGKQEKPVSLIQPIKLYIRQSSRGISDNT